MRTAIHPHYAPATVTCACGEVIHTRSTVPAARIEVCARCSAWFGGERRQPESSDRVRRLRRRYAGAASTMD